MLCYAIRRRQPLHRGVVARPGAARRVHRALPRAAGQGAGRAARVPHALRQRAHHAHLVGRDAAAARAEDRLARYGRPASEAPPLARSVLVRVASWAGPARCERGRDNGAESTPGLASPQAAKIVRVCGLGRRREERVGLDRLQHCGPSPMLRLASPAGRVPCWRWGGALKLVRVDVSPARPPAVNGSGRPRKASAPSGRARVSPRVQVWRLRPCACHSAHCML